MNDCVLSVHANLIPTADLPAPSDGGPTNPVHPNVHFEFVVETGKDVAVRDHPTRKVVGPVIQDSESAPQASLCSLCVPKAGREVHETAPGGVLPVNTDWFDVMGFHERSICAAGVSVPDLSVPGVRPESPRTRSEFIRAWRASCSAGSLSPNAAPKHLPTARLVLQQQRAPGLAGVLVGVEPLWSGGGCVG
jgi:hypothetical protein